MADEKVAAPAPKAGPSDSDRIAALEAQLAASQARVVAMTPQSQVQTNGGGFGVDNHEASWSLAQQEAANAGTYTPEDE